MFSYAAEREEHCKQISLACVGSARSVWVTLGLPPLTECVLSRSTLLRLQVALLGNCLRRALGCMPFLGLCHLVQVLGYPYRDTDSAGPVFCARPRSEQLRRPSGWRVHSSQLDGASYHLLRPSRWVSWVHSGSAISGVLCVNSGALISCYKLPDRCQPSRIPGRLG